MQIPALIVNYETQTKKGVLATLSIARQDSLRLVTNQHPQAN
jgi:hypothetical protein